MDVYRFGADLATQRVVGIAQDAISVTDGRGAFALAFGPRADLNVSNVRLRASATGYADVTTPVIDTSTAVASQRRIVLTPA